MTAPGLHFAACPTLLSPSHASPYRNISNHILQKQQYHTPAPPSIPPQHTGTFQEMSLPFLIPSYPLAAICRYYPEDTPEPPVFEQMGETVAGPLIIMGV